MVVTKIKQMISTNIFLKALLCICIVVIAVFYFKTFYTTGIYFEDTFLKKEVVNSDNHYRGESAFGTIHITVKGQKNKQGNVDVIYRLPNDIYKQYTVNFKDAGNWDLGITSIEDVDGNIIFEGEYRKGSYVLIDKDGKPFIERDLGFRISGENPYDKGYKVFLVNVAELASLSNDTIRGRYEFLILAIFILVFTGIDMKFPLFFFTLQNALSVRDPEPSDLYIAIQRISWYVMPIIALILMIVAIF